jgi:predicted Fe-Mo cluster-binding NifX family protein
VKIAVATEGGQVAEHFGHCPQYTIFIVEDGQMQDEEVIENPGHKPGFLPRYLAERGIDCIIAGGMGPRAKELFEENNIATVAGVHGPVRDVATAYLTGKLETGVDMCHHVLGKRIIEGE